MKFFFSSGDAPFFFADQLRFLSFLPDVWHGEREFGQTTLPSLWIDYPFAFITSLLFRLGISWFVIDKLWWGVVFGLSIVGVYKLLKFFKLHTLYACVGSVIFSTNTYILLLFAGGQLGVALAYAWVPWTLRSVISLITISSHESMLRSYLKTAIILSVLMFLDLRIFYVFAILLIPISCILFMKKKFHITKAFLFIPIIMIGINMFWILPSVQYRESLSPMISKNTDGTTELSFFSVADFPHAFSLLHPNYPENLFGRVYFFKPEFLLIPITAFSIFLLPRFGLFPLVFGVIALKGAFLGKGVHPPFGIVYEWLYNYVPGFFLFRDPTKWYVLTAISHAILIPFSLRSLSEQYFKKHPRVLLVVVFIGIWAFTLRMVFSGEVRGNLSPPHMTVDYEKLATILQNDTSFGRTLWLPATERFGYSSDLHPILSPSSFLSESSPSAIIAFLQSPNSIASIAAVGVSHIIVPQDIEERIFLEGYEYDDRMKLSIISTLDSIPTLTKLDEFESLDVYSVPQTRSVFTVYDQKVPATFRDRDIWDIEIPAQLTENELNTLIRFDPNWRLRTGTEILLPIKSEQSFLTFRVPPQMKTNYTLEYLPATAAAKGAYVSFVVFSLTMCGIFVLSIKKKLAKE